MKNAFFCPRAGCLAILAVLLGADGAKASGPTYTLVPLGNFGGDSFTGGINDSGQIVGWSHFATGAGFHAFLYSNGALQDIGANTTQSQALQINNAGLIVGGTAGSTSYAPCTFSASGAQNLLSQAYFGGFANAVSNNGLIGGYLNFNNFQDQPVTYQNGTYTALPRILPNGGGSGFINGFNNAGQMVGAANYASSSGQTHPFLYSGDTMTDLFASSPSSSGQASAINNTGEIVGYLNTKAFTYDVASATATIIDAYRANAVNDSGTVVGIANNGDGMVYSNGVVQDLNSLIAPGSGWTIEDATGVNASGEICAYAAKGQLTEAVALIPISSPAPEPGSATLAAGGAGLALLRRARRGI